MKRTRSVYEGAAHQFQQGRELGFNRISGFVVEVSAAPWGRWSSSASRGWRWKGMRGGGGCRCMGLGKERQGWCRVWVLAGGSGVPIHDLSFCFVSLLQNPSP